MDRDPENDWDWERTNCSCACRSATGRCPACLVRVRGERLAAQMATRKAVDHIRAGHTLERLPKSIITGCFGWVCSCGHTFTVTKSQVLAELQIVIQ